MNFNEYWNKGGASKLRNRSSSREIKEAAKRVWDKALKHGRTDNSFVDMSFPEWWNEEGYGERIDEKNRWSFFFRIDKGAMKEAIREVWDDAAEFGERKTKSINFDSSNTSFG